MNRTSNQKLFTVILDETNKLKEEDIKRYLLSYFTTQELNKISFIRRYSSRPVWVAYFENSKRYVIAKTLKELVISLIADENNLNEMVGDDDTYDYKRR